MCVCWLFVAVYLFLFPMACLLLANSFTHTDTICFIYMCCIACTVVTQTPFNTSTGCHHSAAM